jgi:hypothetical protein
MDSYEEYKERQLDIATCNIRTSTKKYKVPDRVFNSWLKFYEKKKYPRAPGFCIFVNKILFKKIKGFDETLELAEDHNLAKRISKLGKMGVLKTFIVVSTRRWNVENPLKLISKYLWVELNLLFGREIKRISFDYQFGKF